MLWTNSLIKSPNWTILIEDLTYKQAIKFARITDEAIETVLECDSNCEVTYSYTTESGAFYAVFVAAEVARRYQLKINPPDDREEYEVLVESTPSEQLAINPSFAKYYYCNVPTAHLHHKQQQAVERVVTEAWPFLDERNTDKILEIVRQAYQRTKHDAVRDAIALVWDAALTCLFYLGVDTNELSKVVLG